MANVRDIRRRIRSVKNTQQLTRAMKLVSAAKLRRAQDAIVQARPFAEKMSSVLTSVAARVPSDVHPMLEKRDPERVELLVLAGDRGLCGAFNSSVLRHAQAWVEAQDSEVGLTIVGRKSEEYFRRRGFETRKEYLDITRSMGYAQAVEIAEELMELFGSGGTDAVYLAYNEFRSAISYRQRVVQLLPVAPAEADEETGPSQDYLYEPDPEQLLAGLLPRYCITQVHRALLESTAAEHGARMTAMDSATNNASELIENLTLKMNRVRQASITKELIEVVSGAQSLA